MVCRSFGIVALASLKRFDFVAQKILDPHLKDGIHEWRDGKRFVKDGDRLFIEGTNTLAGRSVVFSGHTQTISDFSPVSVVTLDTCVRNFSRFTGCSLGEAIKCATYNPAKYVIVAFAKSNIFDLGML